MLGSCVDSSYIEYITNTCMLLVWMYAGWLAKNEVVHLERHKRSRYGV
jgi:hypothetical protein